MSIAVASRPGGPGHAPGTSWATPPRLLAGSFLLLIVFGTLGLELLPGIYTGPRLGWVDALFTATSAVCVTGLIVVDTATWFTPFGQGFILLLIQLGGLGMITLTTLIILALGRRLSLRQEAAVISEAGGVRPWPGYRHLTRAIVLFTIMAEALGAALLFLFWLPRFGAAGAVWPAVFHSISAFCNAGFSSFSDSLVGVRTDAGVLLVLAGLIVLGGLGFLVLDELYLRWRLARDPQLKRRFGGLGHRLSLHTRIVLWTTALLILGGWAAYACFEWRLTLAGLSLPDRLVNALFMSVTARTAGFNSIDYLAASDAGNFLTVILMAIGGSPGSTAGGLKTTTIALIGLLAWSRLRGSANISLAGRTVPDETVQRAVGLFVACFGIITAGTLVLLVTEVGLVPADTRAHALLPYMYEATSAFGTVGLSMGITPTLSPGARLLMAVLMYVGRVGPLTFAAALALNRPDSAGQFRYSYEDVTIG